MAEFGKWERIENIDVNEEPWNGEVFGYGSEGSEVMRYYEPEPDGVDSMGHDGGWIGTYAFPGRSIGNPKYFHEPQGQPTHVTPLPPPPED